MTSISQRICAFCLLAGAALLVTRSGKAEVFFVGDFENGAISPWTFAINGNQVQVIDFEDNQVGYVHLTRGSGRSRQELEHAPGGRTAEGLETYWGWSFYFPEPLADCRQDIGYWEQRGVSKRTINVAVTGDEIHLETVFAGGFDFRAQYSTALTAQAWHRVVWHTKWSQNENVGFVEGWYDGQLVLPKTFHKTLLSDSDIFAHVGFLRNDDGADCNYAVQDMYVDNGIEASTLEEAQPFLDVTMPMETMDAGTPNTGGSPAMPMGGAPSTAVDLDPAPAGAAGTPALMPAPADVQPQPPPVTTTQSNASCGVARQRSVRWPLGAMLLVLLAFARRRELSGVQARNRSASSPCL